MRVTIINRHMTQNLGGSEIQCDLLARGLVERGHAVTYVAPVKRSIDVATPYGLRPVEEPSEILAAVLESQPEVVYWPPGDCGYLGNGKSHCPSHRFSVA